VRSRISLLFSWFGERCGTKQRRAPANYSDQNPHSMFSLVDGSRNAANKAQQFVVAACMRATGRLHSSDCQ
jgi:hypothetical protein